MPRRTLREVPERTLYAIIAVAALLVIYAVAFVVSNTDGITVSFVLFEARVGLIWLMLGCILVGGLLGWLVATLAHRARTTTTRPARMPPDVPPPGPGPSAGSGAPPARP